MSTAILYYSAHHGNTKKLVEAIAAKHDVTLINTVNEPDRDLSEFDRLGLASGIYYSNFAKPFMAYVEKNLPAGKPVFFMCTSGMKNGNFLKGVRAITEAAGCPELGAYQCQGFDTFGPFKFVGGVAKGHPTEDEIAGAVAFYEGLDA